MKILKVQPDESQEIETIERCHILELLNKPDDRSQSISRARVEPGVTTAFHKLKGTSEIYYILSGKGRADIGDETHDLAANELVRIPADIPQRITNTGTEDLVFLCFCVPAFSQENYIDLES